MKRIDEVWGELFPAERNRIAGLLIDRINISLERVVMRLKCQGFEHLAIEIGGKSICFPEDGIAEITLAVQARRRCGRTRLIRPADPTALTAAGQVPKPRPEDEFPDELEIAIARAHAWLEEFESGRIRTFAELARREQLNEAYIRRQMQLVHLAPATVVKILDGTHGGPISVAKLTKKELPTMWTEQKASLA